MKDLTERIKETKENPMAENTILKNQIAIMEALQDIQEKMMRIEGKMRNIK